MTTIPITLVTGFLGAGKTSFINALLRDPAFADTAVLINEFGDVAVDHDLVAEFSDDLIFTTTGCICCTASSAAKDSLFNLWNRCRNREIRAFKRVIIETTGLADPVPVINALLAPPTPAYIDRIVTGQFALAHVITLFDSLNGPDTLNLHLEAIKQIALADAIVVTKTDLSNDVSGFQSIHEGIKALNPVAPIWDRHNGWSDIRDLILTNATYDLRGKGEDALAWLQAEAILAADAHDHSHSDPNRHGDGIRAHSIVLDNPIEPILFNFFLDALRLSAGPNLLRVKGLIALTSDPDRPVVVHGVQHQIHTIDQLTEWPSEDHRTRIVVIGRDLNIKAMREILSRPKRRKRTKSPRRRVAAASASVFAVIALIGVMLFSIHQSPAQTVSPATTITDK
jgi:G3E family GTPase